MRTKNFGPTREEATAELRAAFAGLYNELRRRGHDVIVRYDDGANPLYIPSFVEVDGFQSNRLNVRFYVEPYVDEYDRLVGHEFGVVYIPSNTARRSYSEKVRKRSQRLTKNQLTGPALADWYEQRLAVEKRAKELEAYKSDYERSGR